MECGGRASIVALHHNLNLPPNRIRATGFTGLIKSEMKIKIKIENNRLAYFRVTGLVVLD